MGKNHSGDSGSKPVDARVARRRQDAIGRRLRQMYDEVVNEEIPDDFLSFLEQAEGRNFRDGGESQKKSDDEAEPSMAALGDRAVKTEP